MKSPWNKGCKVRFVGSCADGTHKGGIISSYVWSEDDECYFYTVVDLDGNIIDTAFEELDMEPEHEA